MSSIKEHIEREFDVSLPIWIDKSSLVLKAIKDAVIAKISEIVEEYEVSSDFINSDEAKLYKQDDYSLRFNQQQIGTRFKDKFRYLFRRGSKSQINELQDILSSSQSTVLIHETELSSNFDLDNANNIRITDSNSIISGWIADETYPSLNEECTPGCQDNNEYVFTEPCFLLVEVVNNSDFSNEDLKEKLLHEYLPFAIPSIIKFKSAI